MNLKNIQWIVNSGMENWEHLLILEISKDPEAIPAMMKILHAERCQSKELILDMNLELSRADIHLRDNKLLARNQEFIETEIDKFYDKYKGVVGHCFRTDNKK